MKMRPMLSIAAVTIAVILSFLFWADFASEPAPETGISLRRTEIISGKQTAHTANLFPEEPAADRAKEIEKPKSYRLVSTQTVGYGSGERQMGFVDEIEQETAGPESFTVDGEGNFIVCDTLNQRIHILNADGSHNEFQLARDIAPGDVAVFGSESVIVYDYAGRLHQFDFEGNPLGAVEFDRDRWYARLEMHIVDDNVFVQCSDQIDHLVGVLEEGHLRIPTDEELRESDQAPGAHGASGRKYVAQLERWERGSMEIREPNGQFAGEIPLEIPGIVSLRFLGEDSARNAYVQVERVEAEQVVLEVHRFDASGETVAKLEVPENDYYFWTAKLLSIDADGNIYQSLPQPDGMKFNLFQLDNPEKS